MEIRQLKTFRTVAALLSFNRAAERLHYAQSSVSAQIQALEEELEVRLFDRLGRRIMITEAGSRLLRYAEKILDLADETRADLSGQNEPEGSLTIRVPESFAVLRLPRILDRFRKRFPKVRLRFITCTHDGLQKDLRKGVTDLAFLLTDSIQAADLCVEAIGFESLVVVAGQGHPLVRKTVIRTKDLARETFLLSGADCSYRKLFERILEQENAGRPQILELNSVAAIRQCVIRKIGLTIIPMAVVETEILSKQMVVLPWSEENVEVAILMIWYREKWVSPSLKAFMDVAKVVMAETTALGTS